MEEVKSSQQPKTGFNFTLSRQMERFSFIIVILVILCFFRPCSSGSGNTVRKQTFRYSPDGGYALEVTEGSVNEFMGIDKRQMDSLYIARLLATEFVQKNNQLRHELTLLQNENNLWLDSARSFGNRLETYFKTGMPDSTLGAELYKFTARKNLKDEYSNIAQNLFLTRVDENEKLSEREKQQLNDTIRKLRSGINSPNQEIVDLQRKNAELQRTIKRKDSTIYALAHDTARLAIDNRRLSGVAELNERVADKYRNELLDQPLVTITPIIFKPDGVATRSDGTYKVNDIDPKNGLLLIFDFRYNVSLEAPTRDSVYVRYSVRNHNNQKETFAMKYEVKEGSNQFKLSKPDYKFGSGLYVAEIFYLRDSSTIPNVHPDFTARKWSEKELSPNH